MIITCKSCGQELNISDNIKDQICIKEITFCCPACQKEFVYSAEEMANENQNDSANSSAPVLEQAPVEEPLPDYATRESYHKPRILKLLRFSCMDALMTTYRVMIQHLGVMFLMFLVLPLPFIAHSMAKSAISTENKEVINQSPEKLSTEGVSKENKEKDYSNEEDDVTFIMNEALSFFKSLTCIFLFIGCIRLINAYGRNQKASLWLIFSGFDSPIRVFLACLLLILLNGISHDLADLLNFIAPLKSSVYFFAICSTIYALFLFYMLPLIADTNLSTTKSIKLSWLIVRKNILTMFGIILFSAIVIGMIEYFLTSFIGAFFTYADEFFCPLFELYFVGISSICYLKATGQFRE